MCKTYITLKASCDKRCGHYVCDNVRRASGKSQAYALINFRPNQFVTTENSSDTKKMKERDCYNAG